MKLKIIKECSDFLRVSGGLPIIKYLPKLGPNDRRIKIRKRKHVTSFDTVFNTIFIEHADLRQRSLFANGLNGINALPESAENELYDMFYVFPIDGFQFLFSPNIFISETQYEESLAGFLEMLPEGEAYRMFSEMLKYDYTSNNLSEGIQQGYEIIFYGITHYYAVRANLINRYSTLFSL